MQCNNVDLGFLCILCQCAIMGVVVQAINGEKE